MLAAGVVRVLGRCSHHADSSGERLLGHLGRPEQRAPVAANEQDDRTGGEGGARAACSARAALETSLAALRSAAHWVRNASASASVSNAAHVGLPVSMSRSSALEPPWGHAGTDGRARRW